MEPQPLTARSLRDDHRLVQQLGIQLSAHNLPYPGFLLSWPAFVPRLAPEIWTARNVAPVLCGMGLPDLSGGLHIECYTFPKGEFRETRHWNAKCAHILRPVRCPRRLTHPPTYLHPASRSPGDATQAFARSHGVI